MDKVDCRNEHPAGQGGNRGGGSGFGNQNRFEALSNTSNNNRFGGAADSAKPYTLNTADIKLDLTRGQGRPNWILSTYGAGRGGTPASLFEGNEFSPEEMRLRHYELASKGQEGQAEQEAAQLWTKAEQELDNAANNVESIGKFMEDAEQKHPNRFDFTKADGTKTREEIAHAVGSSNTASPASGFGSNGFGQPSTNSNPFAKPAAATFGQPSQPSAFGSSSFGQPAQPSAFGQRAFTQNSSGALVRNPAFGQAGNGFGQSPGGTSTFGQPAQASSFGQPAQASSFGKPAFGASGFGQTAFGQSAQPSTQSPFGQTASTPAFGSSGFGQPAKANPFAAPTASSGFGTAPAFGQSAQGTPAFGQASQPTSGFGQQAQSTPAFGQTSQPSTGFGQQAQNAPAFGQTSQPSAGFGQSTFGQPAQPSGFGQAAFGQQPQTAASSPFGQAPSASSGFGGGRNSAFGQPAQQNTSPFGQASQPKTNEVSMDAEAPTTTQTQLSAQSNPFSKPDSTAPSTQQQSPFVTTTSATTPTLTQPNNTSSQALGPLTSKLAVLHFTQTLPTRPTKYNMNGQLESYRGQAVKYVADGENQIPCYDRPDGKGREKIWFPEGSATPEVAALNKEDKKSELEGKPEEYTEEIKGQYKHLLETGKFKDGKMPLVPPIREWVSHDF